MFQLYSLISLFPFYWQWQRELEEFHNRILNLLKDIYAGCAIELEMVSIHARHAIELVIVSNHARHAIELVIHAIELNMVRSA